jgi:hypothetical protein
MGRDFENPCKFNMLKKINILLKWRYSAYGFAKAA